ncbi:MAG TPA: FMN-binding negative transcriptional regulator [Candidatus Methylacidiphilales bacterium]|nr:FMN-binding negative transcriptional regulator [Candidatus Methylacidiphilales bacterium]
MMQYLVVRSQRGVQDTAPSYYLRKMYIPPANRVDDPPRIVEFIDTYGFATVVTQREGIPWATSLPVLLRKNEGRPTMLVSHMARANGQWQHFASGQEILCIFNGPHAYISPSWYAAPVAVPTWNYASVHVYGIPQIVEDKEGLLRILRDTTSKYEKHMPQPWNMETRLPAATADGLLKAIVGFTISISRIEAKFKLGQNRSEEDQSGMLNGLDGSGNSDAQQLAAFIRKQKE